MRRLVGFVLLLLSTSLQAQRPQEPRTSSEIQLALQKLGVVGNVLYIAAHPDDENTALLSYLASERKLRTGYLSITRGDGGQNLIGDEKGPLLGLIRTQELLAARRVDRAEQFFTRAIDFGYSKNPEETFRVWNREAVLGDVVWVIRKFQPDVIITRFPTTGEGGHGQHTASAMLALDAFTAAADPKRFPDQLRAVKPWQAKRLFWNAFVRQGSGAPVDDPQRLRIDIGSYNELLGRSYSEIAAESRTMHKSQGFGAAERRGSMLNYFRQLAGEPATTDLFEGIDFSWNRVAGAAKVKALVEEAQRSFDAAAPQKSVPDLMRIVAAIEELPVGTWTDAKRAEALELIRDAGGLWLEAIATTPAASGGSPLVVNTMVVARALDGARLDSVAFTDERGRTIPHTSADADIALATNEAVTIEAKLTLPADAVPTHPYWLEKGAPDRGHYPTPRVDLTAMPQDLPSLTAHVVVALGGKLLRYEVPVLYRWTDRVEGEKYRPFGIAPGIVATFSRGLTLFTEAAPKQIAVRFENRGEAAVSAPAALIAPAGWNVTPAAETITLSKRGESATVLFTVTPPKEQSSAELRASLGGKTAQGLVTISYPHIPVQLLAPVATAKAVRADVKHKGESIGYIEGAGDEVAEALEQIGYRVTTLSDADIESGDLSRFDAIVAGVRAYNTREVLKRSPQRIFDYVRGGGTVVVQYNTSDGTLAKQIAPFELVVSRDRVTVEEAPVTFVDPADALLASPNRITGKDFSGWIQERGLYFPNKWGAEFRPLLSMSDPGEKATTGSVIVAKHGEGHFIYTGLAFFRQLPEGVPGAYRLFANLVSAGK